MRLRVASAVIGLMILPRASRRRVPVDAACLEQERTGEVPDRLGDCLSGHFDVAHCTFAPQPVGHQAEPAHHL